ncbi:MAG TPA: hypothetical protein VF049_08805 [Nocardioidaceae bacterium]
MTTSVRSGGPREGEPLAPWRTAACLAWFTGLGFGLPGLYGTLYLARHGEVWSFLGFPTYGRGPFEKVGVTTTVPLLAGFVAVCGAETAVGNLLWRRRRAGAISSLALLPVEAAYWLGFALPLGPVVGAARTLAVLAARRSQRPGKALPGGG